MKQVYCEKEAEIIQALRCGDLDAELKNHVASCSICSDTLAVSEFLQAESTSVVVQQRHSEPAWAGRRNEEAWLDPNKSAVNQNTPFCSGLPDADFLWWKAQLACKRLAVERATRSIAVVRAISYLGVAAAGLWLVFAPGHLGSIVDAVSKNRIWSAGALSQSAVFLGVGTLVFTLLGSLYLVRSEK